jgi:hypothetical protein
MKLFAVAAAVLCATAAADEMVQGMAAEAGAGSSEQAYWLPPASGGMVGGPPQGGGGGGGGMGGPGGSPQMQATPSSPYTSAYSVQPQAFYNFIEERAAQQQQMQHQQLQAAMQQGYGQQVAPPQGPNQFYYIHNAHPETYMQDANRFSEKRSAYRSRQSRRHPSTSAYKKKRNAHKVVGHHSRFAHVATLVEKTHNNQHTHAKAHKDIKHFKKNLKKHAGATQRFKEMVHSAHNKAKR